MIASFSFGALYFTISVLSFYEVYLMFMYIVLFCVSLSILLMLWRE